MEYAQELVTTLHDLTGRVPAAPVDRACVVVPMTEREYATLPTERMLDALEEADPGRVVVALRSPRERVADYRRWLGGFDLPMDVLWCTGDRVRELLDERGLDGPAGKGRDVWLALGVAAERHPYVVCHDADARTYTTADVARLLAPLERDYAFSKAYYARVENDRLYGRLCRLFYAPLVDALRGRHEAPILAYLDAFRYALAGEFAATADLARRLRLERRYGLEVSTLGDAFEHAGVEGTAQVDLGRYEHDHRAVSGPTGLSDMSEDVGAALLRVVEEHGVEPDYGSLAEAYRGSARRLVRQYGADAAFNRLEYDPDDELAQVEEYADAVCPPGEDTRLPAWEAVDLSPGAVLEASRADLAAETG